MRSLPKFFPEWIQLLGLRCWVEIRNAIEFFRIVWKYYSNTEFLKLDLAIFANYLFRNPFKISKSFLLERNEKDIHVYGETPLTTMDFIANKCDITAKDTVIELGCGRGRACFWLHSFVKCKVIGIEYIPDFVEIAKAITASYHLKNIDFLCEDILQSDLSIATVLYLYGSTYEDEFVQALVKKIKRSPKGTKIISVSYPMSDYTSENLFKIIKVFPAQFTWGEADVYLQERI